MEICKECTAGGGNHQLWFSMLAEGVDTKVSLPPTEQEARAILSAGFAKMERVAGSDALKRMRNDELVRCAAVAAGSFLDGLQAGAASAFQCIGGEAAH